MSNTSKDSSSLGRHSLIEVRGRGEGGGGGKGPTLRFLPRAVQQLKLLPRVDTTSHFRHPWVDYDLIL